MKAKLLLAALFVITLCFLNLHDQAQNIDSAQHDTVAGALPTTAIELPGSVADWINTAKVVIPLILGGLITIMSAIQYVLKRVPTQQSIRIQGVMGKLLDFLTAFQKDMNLFGGAHKLLLPLILVVGFSVGAHAQSINKPIPRPQYSISATELGDSLVPGTNYKGFRLQGAGALYSVSFRPLSISTSAVAVVYGIGWENDVWDNSSQRFYQKIGISLNAGPGGQLGSGLIGLAALTVSSQRILQAKLPFKLVVGISYNTNAPKGGSPWGVVTGPINGLNN